MITEQISEVAYAEHNAYRPFASASAMPVHASSAPPAKSQEWVDETEIAASQCLPNRIHTGHIASQALR
ncbi:unannotated protein [freshwater metagenome]|uniref:Unannotated protein n=1 Tax=freshwater metagenome TaxID=449393 RepID=A0A6J7HSJ0_9ZZZZ